MLHYDDLKNRFAFFDEPFICPTCGKMIARVEAEEESRSYYVCPRCRVIRLIKDNKADTVF